MRRSTFVGRELARRSGRGIVLAVLLEGLLTAGCQDVPSGSDVYDPSVGPSRGSTPPAGSGSGGGGAGATGAAGSAVTSSGGSDAGTGGVMIIPVQVDAGSSVDVTPMADGGMAPEAAPVVVTPPAPPALPMCGASKPGEIDEWVSGVGNCSYPVSALPMYAASIDNDIYANGAFCGACLQVSGAKGSVIATVVDRYPVSPSSRGNKISLSAAALNQVAPAGTSLTVLNWRWVPCPATGVIQAALKEGSGQFYWEVQIRNATNRVVKVEAMLKGDKNFHPAKLEAYGYFSYGSANGLPVQLRLTDTEGNVVTTGDLTWANTVTNPISLGVQFPAACAP